MTNVYCSPCVPFSVPPQQYVPLETLVAMLPNFQYQLFFAAENSAALIDDNVRNFSDLFLVKLKGRLTYLSSSRSLFTRCM